ncbi:MAG: indole-3-glycerol phosphate synthase TrpC [Phaeodactylibacter sp.]|nr:indole-3-glycerol phosphate synthase TrpC [Phaeodactylibacter sp.]
MNILEKIIAYKKQEVAERKSLYPAKLLEKSIYFETPVASLKKYLLREDKSGIIAEFKRRSPSKGDINPYASVERVSIGYMQAGASALSVLTDSRFFGGKNEDLAEARRFNFCPILRKDFIIDEYQLIEARSIGADAILLIAECLDKGQLAQLARAAKKLGMEVLMEAHSKKQLDKYTPDVDAIGVNNRNLETFEASIAASLDLIAALPAEAVKVSESGLDDPQAIVELRRSGYQGFLIGEYFMRQADPGKACREFIRRIQHIEDLLQNAIA